MGSELGAVQGWLAEAQTAFAASAEYLDGLDRLIGDGDHGTNMARGFEAAATLLSGNYDSSATLLKLTGMRLLGAVGGASGTLYGTFFLTLAARWSQQMTPAQAAAALQAALTAIRSRGHAELGDKTLVDVLHAGTKSMAAEDPAADLKSAAHRAADAAQQASQDIRPLLAKRGRAALFGEKTIGQLDPGAESMAIIFRLAARHLG